MVILVSSAGFCFGYHTGSNSLSQHLLGVRVTSSPALPHGQDARGQHGPSPCSEVWEQCLGCLCRWLQPLLSSGNFWEEGKDLQLCKAAPEVISLCNY